MSGVGNDTEDLFAEDDTGMDGMGGTDGVEETEEREMTGEIYERKPIGPVSRFMIQHLGGTPVDWAHRVGDQFRDPFDIISDRLLIDRVLQDARQDQVLGREIAAYFDVEDLDPEVRIAASRAGHPMAERNLATQTFALAAEEVGTLGDSVRRAQRWRNDALESTHRDTEAVKTIIWVITPQDGEGLSDEGSALLSLCQKSVDSNIGVSPDLKRLVGAMDRIQSGVKPLSVARLALYGAVSLAVIGTTYQIGTMRGKATGQTAVEWVMSDDDAHPEVANLPAAE